jgi:NitT/TauT family transport system substrate-binding protein
MFVKMLKKAIAIPLAFMLGMGAVASHAEDVAPLDPPQTVKFAYVPIMKFASAYVADSRGLFTKYGLNVEFERVKSGTEAIAFLDQGTVDVGGIAIVASLWSAWSRGLDMPIIAPGALDPLKDGPTVMLVRKDLKESGAIKSVADLKGKRVASAGGPGSGGEYQISKALESAGLTIRDIEMINVGNADMPASLEAKSVDAAMTGSPFSDQAINAGSAEVLAKDMTPGLMTVAFVASGKFISERPEAAKRFVLALAEATQMMQGEDYLSPDNVAGYLKHTATTEEALKKGIPVVYDPAFKIPVAGLADIERVHRENGRTEYDDPIDITKVVNETFTNDAAAALGLAR